MKNIKWTIVTLVLLSLLASQSTGQVAEFNSRETRQELEIMKGVLETTLKFSSQSRERTEEDEQFQFMEQAATSVEGFFLYGQGVVFLVNLPGNSGYFGRNLMTFERDLQRFQESREVNEAFLQSMEEQLRATRDVRERQRDAIRAYREAARLAQGQSEEVPAPPAAPVPPAPVLPEDPPAPPAPAPDPASVQEMNERMAQLEARLAEKKAQFERQSQEMEELRSQVEEDLLVAVAKHGDSLTTVKRSEYVNLILTAHGFGARLVGSHGQSPKTRVLSVPKSAIMDFKAGSIGLDTFKQKVVRYEI